jgi:hypothetical protein
LAIKTDGTLWAWGSNLQGCLGDGTWIDQNAPLQIGTSTNWQKINAGTIYTIGIQTDGNFSAWGMNQVGQLGDGTLASSSTPLAIATAGCTPSLTQEIEYPSVTFYPNPATDFITIKYNGKAAIKMIEILNLNGQVVASDNNSTDKLNIKELPMGFYILHAITANHDYKIKLIKE